MAKDAKVTATLNELLELADDLRRAHRSGAGLERLLGELNAKTGGAIDRPSFRALDDLSASDNETTFVEHLLALRHVAPFAKSETLDAWASALDRHRGRPDAERDAIVGRVYLQYLARELESLSKIPREECVKLAHSKHSASAIATFAAEYVPPDNRAELLALARRWIMDADAKKKTVHAAMGEALFVEGRRVLNIADLEKTVEYLRAGVASRHEIAVETLRKLVGLTPPAKPLRKVKPTPRDGAVGEERERSSRSPQPRAPGPLAIDPPLATALGALRTLSATRGWSQAPRDLGLGKIPLRDILALDDALGGPVPDDVVAYVAAGVSVFGDGPVSVARALSLTLDVKDLSVELTGKAKKRLVFDDDSNGNYIAVEPRTGHVVFLDHEGGFAPAHKVSLLREVKRVVQKDADDDSDAKPTPFAAEITDEPEAEPPSRYATHKKFGRGKIVAETGDVVTVAFEGGERKLQRQFLTFED
jgi:hypothetical protein